MVDELKYTNIPLIFPEYHTAHYSDGKNQPDYDKGYVFEHLDNKSADMDEEVFSVIGTDKLVVSRSTVTSAINLAAYMGARNIILVGHDCGSIDGDLYDPTYTEKDWWSANNYSSAPKWVGSIESQTLKVKERVKEEYGSSIYSLNPFINFGEELKYFFLEISTDEFITAKFLKFRIINCVNALNNKKKLSLLKLNFFIFFLIISSIS